MYPMLFDFVLKEKIWGGKLLYDFLNIEEKPTLIGEAWTISTHKHGETTVINGKYKGYTLQKVLEIEKENLVGKYVYEKYKNKFPLLVKFLNVNDRLSIQVHPDNNYSLKKHNEFGKSETWYIIEASEDATLLLDLKEGISKEKFIEKVYKNDFNNLFKEVKVKKGDVINITPGTIHATIKGNILFSEIQQNSDITYRIYDFDRLDNGKKRELHLEDAINVIDFKKNTKVLSSITNKKLLNLGDNEFYILKKLTLNNDIYDYVEFNSFTILTITKGDVSVIFNDKTYNLKTGYNILIPVGIYVTISGNAEILITTVKI